MLIGWVFTGLILLVPLYELWRDVPTVLLCVRVCVCVGGCGRARKDTVISWLFDDSFLSYKLLICTYVITGKVATILHV